MPRPDYAANLKAAREVLQLARKSLTPSQVHEVEENLSAGEPMVAVEFVVDFLTDNDKPIARELYEKAIAALVAMGSGRASAPHLESLAR